MERTVARLELIKLCYRPDHEIVRTLEKAKELENYMFSDISKPEAAPEVKTSKITPKTKNVGNLDDLL